MASARCLCTKRRRGRRRSRRRDLLRVAFHTIPLDLRGSARSWRRTQADGAGGSLCAGPRMSLRLGRHVQLSGAGVLPEARLRGVRTARLPAGPPAAFFEEAAGLAGVAEAGNRDRTKGIAEEAFSRFAPGSRFRGITARTAFADDDQHIIFRYNFGGPMHITNLRRVGGSVMLAVPPAVLDMLHLQAGAPVGLVVDGGRLFVERQPRPRYTLDELLAQCDPSAELTQEDREWLEAEPVGRELMWWGGGASISSHWIPPTATSNGAADRWLSCRPALSIG